MKRAIMLFGAAALSFLLLAYIDEYENVILPLLGRSKTEVLSVAPRGDADSIKRIISDFTDTLSRAYLLSDPSLLMSIPMDDRLRLSISEEINYLTKEKKVMGLDVKDIEIEKINPLSPGVIEVQTKEMVYLRYLSLPGMKEEHFYPPRQQRIRYMIQATGGLKVLSFEAVDVTGQE